MNQAHIHLVINHLPIFGSMLGGIVLLYGIWTASNETKIASYFLFIISSIGASVAYFTGEGAEESIENIQGIVEASIKQHEEFSLYALVSLIILGVGSIWGIYLTYKRASTTRNVAFIILFIALISFGLVARTGYLGGEIRHTELNSSNNNFNPTVNGNESDND